ncbi:hypothetical protein [Arthrobacter koreensis]|uniref:hypothetical protein n=1 Tax=Arthrobacter koreensis TaxID=199136 RepID=UPI00381E471D
MTTLTSSILNFTAEFSAVQGQRTPAATIRRAVAVERFTAAFFAAVHEQLDPMGNGYVCEDVAESVLDWAYEVRRDFTRIAVSIRGEGITGRWSDAERRLVEMLLISLCENRLRDVFPDYPDLGDARG